MSNYYTPPQSSTPYPNYFPPPINPEYLNQGSQPENSVPPPPYAPPSREAYSQLVLRHSSNYPYQPPPTSQSNPVSPNYPSSSNVNQPQSTPGSLYPSLSSIYSQTQQPQYSFDPFSTLPSAPPSNYPDLYYSNPDYQTSQPISQPIPPSLKTPPPKLIIKKRALFIGKKSPKILLSIFQ